MTLLTVVLFGASATLLVRSGSANADARIPLQVMPVASARPITDGIGKPAAGVVCGSVATMSTADGKEDRQPRTESDWAAVSASAAALIEAGNLLMMGDRLKDKDQWVTRT